METSEICKYLQNGASHIILNILVKKTAFHRKEETFLANV